MQNRDSWAPSKFVIGPAGLETSADPRAVAISSRTAVDVVANFYGRFLPQYARGRLLDLGCGRVPLYQAYSSLADEITCVDWANSAHFNSHLDLVHDLNTPLPFESGRFDTIILSDVLEHIPEPEKLWLEMARVTAPGGHVIMNVPFLYWLHEEPHDFHRYTEHALRRLADRAGFEVVELTPLGGSPHVLADILGKTLATARSGRRLVPLLHRLNRRFVRKGLGKRIADRTARRFPLGYGMVARLRPRP